MEVVTLRALIEQIEDEWGRQVFGWLPADWKAVYQMERRRERIRRRIKELQ